MILEFIVFSNMPFFWYKLCTAKQHKVYLRRPTMDSICQCADFLVAIEIHAKQRCAAEADEYARKETDLLLLQLQEQEQEQYIDYYMLHYRIMYRKLLASASVKQRYKDEFVAALGKSFCEKCAQYNFHEMDVQFCFHDSGTQCQNCLVKDKTLKNKRPCE